jgi:hypothetical protein
MLNRLEENTELQNLNFKNRIITLLILFIALLFKRENNVTRHISEKWLFNRVQPVTFSYCNASLKFMLINQRENTQMWYGFD